MKHENLNIAFFEGLRRRLKILAAIRGTSMAKLVTRILLDYVEKNEK